MRGGRAHQYRYNGTLHFMRALCPKYGGNPMASTEERVKNIVVDLLGVEVDRVVPAARFREDLEADSLDLVELIMAFEEEFGGEITDEDAQTITTVGEAVKYIDTHMS